MGIQRASRNGRLEGEVSMAYTDTGRTTQQRSQELAARHFRETKPSFATTEFWVMVAGLAAIVVIYLASADRSFTLWRAMLLGTVVGVGYMMSRGLSKAGSHDDRWDVRDPDTWRGDPRREGR
jgi:hypothetical protein